MAANNRNTMQPLEVRFQKIFSEMRLLSKKNYKFKARLMQNKTQDINTVVIYAWCYYRQYLFCL